MIIKQNGLSLAIRETGEGAVVLPHSPGDCCVSCAVGNDVLRRGVGAGPPVAGAFASGRGGYSGVPAESVSGFL